MAVCVCAAAFFFLNIYHEHDHHRQELTALSRRFDLMNRQYQEMVRQQHLLGEMAAFVDRAGAKGLTPDKWSSYAIDIEKPMSFELAAGIIDQCAGSAFAYYKPDKLIAKKISGETAATPAGDRAGDMKLQLKGQFIARHP